MKPGPYFFAWCDEAERVDAFAAALPALVIPGRYISVTMGSDVDRTVNFVDEAVAMIRAHFGRTDADTYFAMELDDRRSFYGHYRCFTGKSERLKPRGPIHLVSADMADILPLDLYLALGSGPRSVEAEAELTWHIVLDYLEDLLLRLCAPDASRRVSTGGCTSAWTWLAPVSMCATYNADARDIARDLALSWVSLHDKEKVSLIAGMSLEALHARIDAAPAGARVVPTDKSGRSIPLSRETVLKALAMPGSALIEALVAAADVPDEAWRAAEPRAEEIHNLTVQARARGEGFTRGGGSLTWVELTGEHVYFLVDHARFHVRRLPNGGILLATHPYRTLWPLWADALFALGLMS
ncbi:hypothetical protein WME75_38850 [Sorangium sp. So ce1014]|uniref:hypothetical protein n=1 Tax=Sorangium sp. So ce1014 TaxID=3133326 RepID=UPI003F5DB122